jgi:hypothetical protein
MRIKERILNEYYRFKLAQDGIKLQGHSDYLYYGNDKNGFWYIYICNGFTVIQLKRCATKLHTAFVYHVLLSKLK